MLVFGIFLILSLLTLFQIDVFPVNFAFVFIVSFYLLSKRDFSFWWVLVTSVIVGLFTNLNIGLVLISFTATFLLIDLGARLFPDNRLVKGGLIIAAVILSEYSLVGLGRVFG